MTDSDLNVSISLIRHLNAKNCIFIEESKDIVKTQNTIKYLAFGHNIFTTFKTSDELVNYIEVDEYESFKTDHFPALHPHKIVIVCKITISDIHSILMRVCLIITQQKYLCQQVNKCLFFCHRYHILEE